MRGALIVVGLVLAFVTSGCSGISGTQKGNVAASGVETDKGHSAGGNTQSSMGGLAEPAPRPLAKEEVASYMDRQEQALRQSFATLDYPGVRRQQDVVMLTFRSDRLFAPNSAKLTQQASGELDRAARIVSQYPQTQLQIEAHTDNTGSAAQNQSLSEKRAQAVAEALAARGISPSRLRTVGFGQTRPIAPNDTEVGRQMNRRVTINIIPIQQA